MTQWEEFYPLVMPQVQGCPVAIVDAAIRAACGEFCSRTLIWNQEVVCGDLVAGIRDYKFNNKTSDTSIVMPLHVIIREVKDGKINDHHVCNTNLQDLDTYAKQWRLSKSSMPQGFYMKTPQTLVFVEEPTRSIPDAIHMLCAVKPSRKDKGVPDFLFEDWGETIAAGALLRLHAMAGRVWADPQVVSYHTRNFRDGISRAKSKFVKSWTAQSKTMLPKIF